MTAAAMSKVYLDTSFLIRALAAGTAEDRTLRTWLRAGRQVRISSIAWAEFLCGPLSAEERELARAIVGQPTPFSDEDAALAADLFNESGRRRRIFLDCLIAAAALRGHGELATSSPDDFEAFAERGLSIARPD
jgi:predicted nucleic acid-binding protein